MAQHAVVKRQARLVACWIGLVKARYRRVHCRRMDQQAQAEAFWTASFCSVVPIIEIQLGFALPSIVMQRIP